ncbi:MAG: YbaB/EbfC family nucleoid-associated protein [Oscillospiraceae bacterium]|jgi:DNA-binding YbaB/EbfC family protein|nr:YbaB/EbfC family nucleoid-associated protein [Oscillospiraceae bacterium]
MAKHFQGGGMGGANMMKQVQKMQQDMLCVQEEIESKTFTASAGGGAVNAAVNGKRQLLSVTLQPDVVDPEDIEMLQDLIVAAANEALREAEEEMAQAMQRFTGGLRLPF